MFKKMKKFLVESEKESTQRGSGFVNSLDIDTIELSLKQGMLLPVLIEVDGKLLSEAKYVGQDGMYRMTIESDKLTIIENKADSKKLMIPLASNFQVEISFAKKFLLDWGIPQTHIYTAITIHSEKDKYDFVWSGFTKTPNLIAYLNKNNIEYQIEGETEKILAERLSDEELKRKIEQEDRIGLIANDKLASPM